MSSNVLYGVGAVGGVITLALVSVAFPRRPLTRRIIEAADNRQALYFTTTWFVFAYLAFIFLSHAANFVNRRLMLLLAVPAGVLCAYKAGSRIDRLISSVSLFLLAAPVFITAIVLMFIFALKLRWLPSTGYVSFTTDPLSNLAHFALPALAIGLSEWPPLFGVLRADMIKTLQQDYIALARAKGTVDQIRAAITSLEGQLAKAQQRGDSKAADEAAEAIAARQSWLEEAERTLAELSS